MYIRPAGPLAAFVANTLGQPTDAETGRFYRNPGGGRFEDATAAYGLSRVLLSGGLGVGDVDNDGFLDLYIGTAYPGYEGLLPNVLYRNRDGRGFADVTTNARLGHLQKDGGIALADLDRAGDQDIFVNLGGMYRGDTFGNALFANPGFGAHWLDVQLVGRGANRSAIGARIRAEIADGDQRRSVYRFVGTGSSYGANPLRQWIGLGAARKVERLEITWPDRGRTQVLHNVAAEQRLVVAEEDDERPSRR